MNKNLEKQSILTTLPKNLYTVDEYIQLWERIQKIANDFQQIKNDILHDFRTQPNINHAYEFKKFRAKRHIFFDKIDTIYNELIIECIEPRKRLSV